MTTHEALELKHETPVYFVIPVPSENPTIQGLASLEQPNHIRVIWPGTHEPDSLIRVTDRLLLSSIIISEPPEERYPGTKPGPND